MRGGEDNYIIHISNTQISNMEQTPLKSSEMINKVPITVTTWVPNLRNSNTEMNNRRENEIRSS